MVVTIGSEGLLFTGGTWASRVPEEKSYSWFSGFTVRYCSHSVCWQSVIIAIAVHMRTFIPTSSFGGIIQSPTLFLGSTDCLDILLLVRLPVYRAARALHRTWDMNTHSPLSVYHLLYSILTPQHPVPLASMSPNRPRQLPQHPRASPVAPFSPHLKDCPLYSRNLFCFSNFFCRSVTQAGNDSTHDRRKEKRYKSDIPREKITIEKI